ncbi:aspartate/glutamate racemase family protein [Pseudothermotoga sp.]
MIVQGGKTLYGFTLGVITLHTHFPRVPGDVGNARTWRFPVLYKILEGLNPKAIIGREKNCVEEVLNAARELEAAGVKVITTSCGFLAMLQEELACAVSVPVITSSLLLVPLVHRICGMKPVGILTANSQVLGQSHLTPVGAAEAFVEIVGLENTNFGRALLNDEWRIDFEEARNEVVEAAKRLVEKRPELGCIVLECTNLPPFAADVQRVTKLPVFDLTDLVNMVCFAVEKGGTFPWKGATME